MKKRCVVVRCVNLTERRSGLCNSHQSRLDRHGSTYDEVPLGELIPSLRERWFCECAVPEWDGLECVRCGRKPRARMKVAV